MKKYLSLYWSLICYRIPALASRKEYFVTCLVGMVISYVLLGVDLLLDPLLGGFSPDFGIGIFQAGFSVWMLIPGWRFASSRLRDTGRYTWKSLLWVLVPVIGFFVILWRLTRPTGAQSSQGGPSGSSKEDWGKFSSGVEVDSSWKLNHSLVLK